MNEWGISGIVTDSTGGLIVPTLYTSDILMGYVTALAKWEKNVPSEEIHSSLKGRSFGLYSPPHSVFLSFCHCISFCLEVFRTNQPKSEKLQSYKELNQKFPISFD